jgi:hypothetical protein
MEQREAFEVLQLSVDATADDVRVARRRLAKDLHPDHGGDADRMRELNVATAAALEAIGDRAGPHLDPVAPAPPPNPAPAPPARGPRRVVEDVPSFVVEALPVVTFELLSSVAPLLGRVLDEDPPYVLEVAMRHPASCWCRLEVLPDAGASTVNLYVGAFGVEDPPTVEAVRDVWIGAINEAEWPLPS